MHYFSQDFNPRKPLRYDRIVALLIVAFIIYANHNLIAFTNLVSEAWFDVFVISSFLVLVGTMLLTDKIQWIVIDNPAEVRLPQNFASTRMLQGMVDDDRRFVLIINNHKKILSGTNKDLQQQLLDLLKGQIEPEVITAFINNFYWLELNCSGVEQIKNYFAEHNTEYDFALVNQANHHNILQVKLGQQELVLSQKGLYKKLIYNNSNQSKVEKVEYLFLRQTCKVKKNSLGTIVKFDEKIVAKSMFGVAFNFSFSK